MTPDFKVLLEADGNELKLIDGQTEDVIKHWQAHDSVIWSTCLSADGQFAISGCDGDQQAKIWDLEYDTCLKTIDNFFNFSPYAKYILSAASLNYYQSVALSPDGRIAATCQSNGTIKITDLSDYIACKKFLQQDICVDQALFLIAAQDGNYAWLLKKNHLQEVAWSFPTALCKIIAPHFFLKK